VAWTHTRSKIAHAKKIDPDADVTHLRQQLKAERLEEYVLKVVNEAPPLTDDQRERLARLLGSHWGDVA
jgi:hypothetical protein